MSKLKSYVSSKVPDDASFCLPDIDESFVFNFLSTLDISKATGLDSVGPRFLKLSSGIIAKSLTTIANKCLSSGSYPAIWKQDKVSPLHKRGTKEELNSYRPISPISILPTLSKLLEKSIQKHFMEYLNTFDLIHKSQSGFRAGHSTESALLLMTERWLKALDEGKVVGSVMVDFRTAFDLVDQSLLLENLSCYRISDNFFQLMKSYLHNRTQLVSVNNEISNEDSVKCGVPQGSILGSILFFDIYK